ncbi:pyridoxamine 5'-phosphate oxidase [Desulfonema ishimotonii]|uniref:Pyridoxamine 5'-phosphate oxidase n=1 Tax=Desulfonema ishimotonii TaxID=45657 RepID=A0A401FSU4_9BACT|nr:pyridoxamine 5'-phosphate oxidase family protein [Desulfonema ishimotonii]GBC60037.1 pyridoxamine 5'-phosphate oxidase [Desulfonema ishimotonii]
MELKEYFETVKGTGVLATADKEGRVDVAVYSRPHIMEDGTLALIMRDRLTHYCLQSNPHAAYMFIEACPGYRGKRLFLTKLREEEEGAEVAAQKRRSLSSEEDAERGPKFLVVFHIDRVLPLIGPGD